MLRADYRDALGPDMRRRGEGLLGDRREVDLGFLVRLCGWRHQHGHRGEGPPLELLVEGHVSVERDPRPARS